VYNLLKTSNPGMHIYLIKYTAEIGTKSDNTRWKFIKRLAKNIRTALSVLTAEENHSNYDVAPLWQHIIVKSEADASGILKRIAGIKYFVKVKESRFKDLESLALEAYAHFHELVEAHDTFAVRCRKTAVSGFGRMDVERICGEKLLPHGMVRLKEPDITCHIEIRADKVFFYHEKIEGMAGVPLGIQGKVLTLLSGGIDSPVAAWKAYKMGLDQDFLYFDLGADNVLNEKVPALVHKLKHDWGYGSSSQLYKLDLVPLIKEIIKTEPSYQNLLLKYFFYKLADKLADTYAYPAILSGESLGQVSTQTLSNLAALDKLTDKLIIRPLIAFSKDEIMEIAESIGTLDLAYKGAEFCAISKGKVITAGSYEKLTEYAGKVDSGLIEAVMNTLVQLKINSGSGSQSVEPPKKLKIPENAVVINLSDMEESIEKVSFQEAMQTYNHWDMDAEYFIICDKGVQSKMLSTYMKEAGFKVSHLEGGLSSLD
jgi:tRNA uracil 4-sulfurtransferase